MTAQPDEVPEGIARARDAIRRAQAERPTLGALYVEWVCPCCFEVGKAPIGTTSHRCPVCAAEHVHFRDVDVILLRTEGT